jgi:hypothetical protein
MIDDVPKWNPLFADFMASLGVAPRVCKPFKPQTKGKVERSVEVIKYGFWPGVRFSDIDDLNGQATRWCDRLKETGPSHHAQNPTGSVGRRRVKPFAHRLCLGTQGPRGASADAGMGSSPTMAYGTRLPATPPVAGSMVLVRERERELRIFHQGSLIATVQKQPRSRGACHPS